MISPDDAAAEAALLDQAEISALQIRQTTQVYPNLTIDDAYAIQAAWQDIKVGRGESLVGHKIGLTSRAMQAAMNITTPDSGFITDKMVFEPDGQLDAATFLDPKLEVELAFVLGQDLSGTDLGVEDVLDATDYVVPAVELIAARSFRKDPTMLPTAESSWVAPRSPLGTSTLPGSARLVRATARSKKPGLRPVFSDTRRWALCGLRNATASRIARSRPVRSCWRARSPVRSMFAGAIPSISTTARSVRLVSASNGQH